MNRLELSQDLAADLLDRARRRGVTQADVFMVAVDSLSVNVRLGEVEKVKQAQEKRLGLRLFFGQSSASTATSDISTTSLDQLLDQTCALARATSKDEFSGLPDARLLANSVPDLELFDENAADLSVEDYIKTARIAEGSALRYDPRINNSEGAELRAAKERIVYASTHGFCGEYKSTGFRLFVLPVGQANGSMQRDYWYSAARKLQRLDDPVKIGEEAGRRLTRRFGARKVATNEIPVVFDPQTAGSLLSHLSRAMSGYAVYQGGSFLKGQLGKPIAAEGVTVIDDGTIPAALGSKPFDAEGARVQRKSMVDQGILASYLLDAYSARKLGLTSTGNAFRAVGAPPGVAPTNLYLAAGEHTPEEIIASVDQGFYVTELMGFGVNLVNGDYSRGAAGLWIEKGKLAYPVEEVTIAGNLRDMFAGIEMIGNDLVMRSSISSPTIKISRMTLAGS